MVSCSVASTIFSLILSCIGLPSTPNYILLARLTRLLAHLSTVHINLVPVHNSLPDPEIMQTNQVYSPILIPDAPSASAATNPRPSAMPPEARYGTFNSSAARASYVISVYRPMKIVFAQHTNTNPGTSSSPGCPAPVVNPIRRSPRVQCSIRNTHSRPSILTISTPSFSDDYIAVF